MLFRVTGVHLTDEVVMQAAARRVKDLEALTVLVEDETRIIDRLLSQPISDMLESKYHVEGHKLPPEVRCTHATAAVACFTCI